MPDAPRFSLGTSVHFSWNFMESELTLQLNAVEDTLLLGIVQQGIIVG